MVNSSTLFSLSSATISPLESKLVFNSSSIFSSTYLKLVSTINLVAITIFILIFLTFFHFDLPIPKHLHFNVPDYYLYAIPLAIIIGLIFLVYFGLKFGGESRKRKEALDNIQNVIAKEHELLSLGGQAAAAAHSLGTPLATIAVVAKELKKEIQHLISLRRDAQEFMLALRASGRKIILVTNAHPDSLSLKIEQTQLDKYFDVLYSTHEFGVTKESQLLWQRLQEKEGFSLESTLFVDDSINILDSAKRYGIGHLLAVTNPDSKQPAREIADYPAISDFRTMLDEIKKHPITQEL